MESNYKSLQVITILVTISRLVFDTNGVENYTSLESIATTISAPNTSKSEYRVYLVRQTLDKDLNEAILRAVDDEEKPPQEKKRQNSSTTQIYIIAVIGISPAVIGGIMWFFKNLRKKCVREKTASKRCKGQEPINANPFLINEGPIDQITYKIVQRADQLNKDTNTLWYNSYKPSYFVKSRRVYSMEVSRKNLHLIEILGEGNFGQVWKARAVQIGNNNKSQTVAVKTNKINTDEKDAEDLLKELDIMLQLGNHPNVVKLLGCCTENVPYFLIMDFVSKGKLLSYLRKHRNDKTYYTTPYNNINSKTESKEKSLSSKDLVLFAYQIAKGMEFISSHGIIHRDLAARNILVDENNNCKVADFGLSRSIRDKDSDQYEQKRGGQMPVRWMSPESLQMGLFSSKSDVWSYGILIWEIITLGSTPYIGLSAQQVIKYVSDKQIIERPEHCSDHFYDLIKLCFAFECENRLTFTDIRLKLSKMIESQFGYVDLQHFNDSLYYNLTSSPTDEKV